MTRTLSYTAIAFIIGFAWGQALAAQVDMPIKAEIIQCGTREQAKLICLYRDERCCAVAPVWEIVPDAGGDDDTDGRYVEPEVSDDGLTVNFE